MGARLDSPSNKEFHLDEQQAPFLLLFVITLGLGVGTVSLARAESDEELARKLANPVPVARRLNDASAI
jgi:hypothetical protein